MIRNDRDPANPRNLKANCLEFAKLTNRIRKTTGLSFEKDRDEMGYVLVDTLLPASSQYPQYLGFDDELTFQNAVELFRANSALTLTEMDIHIFSPRKNPAFGNTDKPLAATNDHRGGHTHGLPSAGPSEPPQLLSSNPKQPPSQHIAPNAISSPPGGEVKDSGDDHKQHADSKETVSKEDTTSQSPPAKNSNVTKNDSDTQSPQPAQLLQQGAATTTKTSGASPPTKDPNAPKMDGDIEGSKVAPSPTNDSAMTGSSKAPPSHVPLGKTPNAADSDGDITMGLPGFGDGPSGELDTGASGHPPEPDYDKPGESSDETTDSEIVVQKGKRKRGRRVSSDDDGFLPGPTKGSDSSDSEDGSDEEDDSSDEEGSIEVKQRRRKP
jgi:hypothetical protein